MMKPVRGPTRMKPVPQREETSHVLATTYRSIEPQTALSRVNTTYVPLFYEHTMRLALTVALSFGTISEYAVMQCYVDCLREKWSANEHTYDPSKIYINSVELFEACKTVMTSIDDTIIAARRLCGLGLLRRKDAPHATMVMGKSTKYMLEEVADPVAKRNRKDYQEEAYNLAVDLYITVQDRFQKTKEKLNAKQRELEKRSMSFTFVCSTHKCFVNDKIPFDPDNMQNFMNHGIDIISAIRQDNICQKTDQGRPCGRSLVPVHNGEFLSEYESDEEAEEHEGVRDANMYEKIPMDFYEDAHEANDDDLVEEEEGESKIVPKVQSDQTHVLDMLKRRQEKIKTALSYLENHWKHRVSPIRGEVVSSLKVLEANFQVFSASTEQQEVSQLLQSPKGGIIQIRSGENLHLYDYQRSACQTVLGAGQLNSGVIVLPCGAGKTIVGIHIACGATTQHPGGRVLVVCNSRNAIKQWRDTIFEWTNLSTSQLVVFGQSTDSAEQRKKRLNNARVILTTYHMLSIDRATQDNKAIRAMLLQADFACLVLDEAHHATSKKFSEALRSFSGNLACKVGLTATLRSDMKEELFRLIGPQLIDIPMQQLVDQNKLSVVNVSVYVCEPHWPDKCAPPKNMGPLELQRAVGFAPGVLCTTIKMLDFFSESKTKVMVISDFLHPLKILQSSLGSKALLAVGKDVEGQRNAFRRFQTNSNNSILLISRVGDEALNLPDTQVVIVLTWRHGSEVQLIQRVGRAARLKSKGVNVGNCFILTVKHPGVEKHVDNATENLKSKGYQVKRVEVSPSQNELNLLKDHQKDTLRSHLIKINKS